MVLRKSTSQIALMRRAGAVVAEMHEACTRAAVPGATTADLDSAAREVLDRRHARSNFLNYHGFPAVICTSPNDMIVHGIPGSYVLEEGDIVYVPANFLASIGLALQQLLLPIQPAAATVSGPGDIQSGARSTASGGGKVP